jgi:hypothetical protein
MEFIKKKKVVKLKEIKLSETIVGFVINGKNKNLNGLQVLIKIQI